MTWSRRRWMPGGLSSSPNMTWSRRRWMPGGLSSSPTSPEPYGKKYVECLTAARFERKALEGVQWDIADAPTIFNDVASEKLFKQVGAAGELKPLDLSDEPELQALVAEVDISELEDA
jgi:hypothetical protein